MSAVTDSPTYAEFEARHRAEGYDEVLVREWAPAAETGIHTHPFDVKAMVVAGDLWLTVGEDTRELHAGDRFELTREVPHAERYGPAGATFWVARRR